MKHVIVYAHPNTESFNHAILETVKSELEGKGHEVRVRDLYELNFNPVLGASDFISFSKGNTPEDIKEEQEHISWADSITFIYPVWWAGLPAILKGYVDRVFSHGFAYAYSENGIEKLLSGKKGLLLSTMGNTKEAYTAGGMFDAMKKQRMLVFLNLQALKQLSIHSIQVFLLWMTVCVNNILKRLKTL